MNADNQSLDTLNFNTSRTVYFFVTCCMEESRFEILKKITKQFINQDGYDKIKQFLYVFDNGSTHPCMDTFLQETFVKQNVNVISSKENLGYWSAIKWFLDNVDLSNFDYIHIIESDHYYYDSLHTLSIAENYLATNDLVGGVRLQEYQIDNQNLYNKSLNMSNGRKYAWVSHVNSVTGAPVKLSKTNVEKIYVSNFLTVLHALNRVAAIKTVFDRLGSNKNFSELDFQTYYHDLYKIIAVFDGGIFHAKLGFTPDDPSALSGSWSHNVNCFGYKTTRQDIIQKYSDNLITKYGNNFAT